MKQIFTLLLIVLAFSSQAQLNQNQVVFSKVTATWCPNCGSWGWDLMEGAKDALNQRDDALVLGVHYSGNLKSDVGEWWSSNLNAVGQPTFFINNTEFDVNSGNWNNNLATMPDLIDNNLTSAESFPTFYFLNAFVNDQGRIETNLVVRPDHEIINEEYCAIYIFENSVEEVQSGQSGKVMHPNVLRSVIGGETGRFEGDILIQPGDTWTAAKELNFWTVPNSEWNLDNIGLLAVWWEKIDDTYIIKQATSVKNIGLLSNVDNTLDESLFTVMSTETSLDITTDSKEEYNYTLSNVTGKIINQGALNGKISISTNHLTSGMYLINIQKGNKYFTEKVFIK